MIPLDAVASDRPTPTNRGGSGIALNGVRLDGPAPLDAILGAYTIAPFDDCGGHVNLHVGYHYHVGSAASNQILGGLAAETGCTLVEGQTVCDASRPPPRP